MAVLDEPSSPVFVGRERELGIISGLLDRSDAGEAQSVLVSGDPGVGKTALVTRACSNGFDALTIFGACLPLTSMSIPLLPIRAALRGIEEAVADAGIIDAGGDERDVAVRFDKWLDRSCRAQHVVLVVDDVQWADQSTLDALMYVIAGPARRRLTVVSTLRTDVVGLGHPLRRWLADIRRLPRTSELPLMPLDRDGTAAQIHALLEAVPHQSLIDGVHGRTRGNPYFTRLMVTGLAPDAREAPTAFPEDLSSAVLQSWYRLSPETRRMATVLAVGGKPMHTAEFVEVFDGSTDTVTLRTRLGEAADAGTLDILGDGAWWFHHPLNAEVLAAALPDDERREWHHRFADVLEARTEDPVPVALAVAIADHRFGAGESLAAFEWALRAADAAGDAGGRAEQLRLLRRAVGLRESLSWLDVSATDLLRRIRAVAADIGATEDELYAVEVLLADIDEVRDPLVAAELRVRRMHLRFMTGQGFIDVGEMQDAVRLAAAAAPNSPEYAFALAELAHAELWAESPGGVAHAHEAVAVAREADDARGLAHALTACSMAAGFDDDATMAHEYGEQGVTAAIDAHDWFAYVHAVLWEANAVETWASEWYADRIRSRRIELSELGGPHAYVAWLSAVEASSLLAVGLGRECDERLRVALGSDPGVLGDVAARLTAARLAALQGRTAEAEGHLLRADELFADGSAFLAFEFDAVRAEVRLAAGDHLGAHQAALQGAIDRGAPPTMCEWLIPLAARALADHVQAARDAGGDVVGALQAVDELFRRFPHPIADLGTQTLLVRRQMLAFDAMYAAERARAHGAPAQADLWIDAVDACVDARLPWEEAYTIGRAAEALLGRRNGRLAGADMVRRGLELARRLGARPVETELTDLAGRARIPVGAPVHETSAAPAALHGLTQREREVLDLVAVGRTYSEIARTLMISEKTVSTHVSHLLAKTGTSNRVELARLVARVAQ